MRYHYLGSNRGSLNVCVFFIIYTLHQNTFFFHLRAITSVLWKFLIFFLDIKLDIFSPWINEKTMILFFMFSMGKIIKLHIQKKWGKLPFGPIIYAKKAWYDTMYNFQKYFFLNACKYGTFYSGVYTRDNHPTILLATHGCSIS